MSERNNQNVCLLDWDGTLREAFVVFDWVQFLVRSGVISTRHKTKMSAIFARFNHKQLSYESMAREVVSAYAESMRGLNATELDGLVRQFWTTDAKLFDFTIPLLEMMRGLGITPVLVSGAPLVVVKPFAETIGIDECFGLELGLDSGGIYNGSIVMNLAISSNKQAVVDSLLEQGRTVVLAFGDSASDAPLLEAARFSYIVAGKEKKNAFSKDFLRLLEEKTISVVSPSELGDQLADLREILIGDQTLSD